MREDITFESDGNRLLGHLFLPEGLARGERSRRSWSSAPSSSTKGQVPARLR